MTSRERPRAAVVELPSTRTRLEPTEKLVVAPPSPAVVARHVVRRRVRRSQRAPAPVHGAHVPSEPERVRRRDPVRASRELGGVERSNRRLLRVVPLAIQRVRRGVSLELRRLVPRLPRPSRRVSVLAFVPRGRAVLRRPRAFEDASFALALEAERVSQSTPTPRARLADREVAHQNLAPGGDLVDGDEPELGGARRVRAVAGRDVELVRRRAQDAVEVVEPGDVWKARVVDARRELVHGTAPDAPVVI
mmetsp:Transcript_495/g.2022  ORF Transcript_495/g.2022 Transcript_495/m.2022 type:complete len:249 (+) Transcript_495:500-1246(+)